MAYLWWGRANRGKTDHLWVDDVTLCGLKTKTRHTWLHSSRRCSQCLEKFNQDTALQIESQKQDAARAQRKQRLAESW